MPFFDVYTYIFARFFGTAFRRVICIMNKITSLSLMLALAFVAACTQNTPNSGNATIPGTEKTGPELWKNQGCNLITDQEVEQLFGIERMRDILNARTLPDQTFCLRTWNKADWKERELHNEKNGTPWKNPKNTLVVQVFDYTSEEHARLQMERLRRDRRQTYEEDVTGIGDEGLWSSSTVTLLARKGQYVLNLTLEYYDEPHENLSKAKEVAAVAIQKI